ncbi:type 2 periplasmic-binding domain-containing protein [Paracoccus binzhouensis]|uniref:hypothetical protein n=1 Tax=Paracoccus binzhouensis TaxID=2796149 RepID=UPI0018EF24BC|nr:hypothetical protein [Paracoccus binzhouensis]
MENPWPAGVPLSLWTYNGLRPDALAQLPMMGIKFAPGFLYAFAFGCIFIAIFAWKRFQVRTDVRSVSRALCELSPSDIGGHGALIRAYFIYAGAILLLYVSLTFFGRLILQSTQMIPVAGIQMDLDKLQFDSLQWPLMLAFAFAGLAEMLPPVKVTEGWLRNRAYRAVGIPVRLEQTMRNLIVTLDAACSADGSSDELSQRLRVYRDRWAATLARHVWTKQPDTQRQSRHEEMILLLAQLEILVFWAKSARGNWPGHEVSASVREMERKYVADAVALLDEVHGRMFEEAPEPPDKDLRARRARFAEFLAASAARAEALRFDLVGILAIFLERDPDSPADSADTAAHMDGHAAGHPAGHGAERTVAGAQTPPDPALHRLLTRTERPDTAGTGPEAGLFLALIAVFLFYAAAAWRGILEPIGAFVETSNVYGVLATALVETLRIAALTWLPLLAAFSLRQYLWDNGDWAGSAKSQRRSGYAAQIFGCLCLGVTVSVIALAAVAALRAFFVAPTSAYFFSLYVGSVAPFVIYYPSQAIILLVLIPMALLSADLRKGQATRLWYGVACAIGVALLSMEHLQYWNPTLAEDCPALGMLASANCAKRFDLTGHLVLAVLAFLSAGVFGKLPQRLPGHRPHRPAHGATAALLALLLVPVAGKAQTLAPDGSIRLGGREPVVMGVRIDAPPFSYALPGAEPDRPGSYRGFLADLCFDIFAGSARYDLVVRPVTAGNRFDGLHPAAQPAQRIDMLCDAVTMRFSDPERTRNSVFSPIVFASGVSYLDKVARRPRNDVLIGYIGNSTARDVAFKTCEIDRFNALLPFQRPLLYQRCKLRWSAAAALEELRRAGDAPDTPRTFAANRRLAEALAALVYAAERLDAATREAEIQSLDPGTARLLAAVLGKAEAGADRMASDIAGCLKTAAGADRDAACARAFLDLQDPACAARPEAPEKTERRKPIEQLPWPDYHFCPLPSHAALIEWFCAGPGNQRRIYMGDRELILDRLQGWNAAHGPCLIERPDGAEYLSYEPYAFPVSLRRPELIQFVQRRIYEIFSYRADMNSRFSASFRGREMSPALAYLFLLNAVVDEAGMIAGEGGNQPRDGAGR